MADDDTAPTDTTSHDGISEVADGVLKITRAVTNCYLVDRRVFFRWSCGRAVGRPVTRSRCSISSSPDRIGMPTATCS